MKKIYSAIGLLVAALILCLSENLFINHATDRAINQVSMIQNYVKKNEMNSALKLARELKSDWKNDMSILCVLCDHRDVDQIEEYIHLIETTLAEPEFDETFWSECTKASLQLENLKENQEVSLVNIL